MSVSKQMIKEPSQNNLLTVYNGFLNKTNEYETINTYIDK